MDSLTHVVLGACVGEIIAGKQLGKKALLLGAVANSLPDIDFVAAFFLPVTRDLLAHRGFTHSILCNALLTPILAWCCHRLFHRQQLPFRRWVIFWGVLLFLHIFIDAFNAYGTGWFEPFSHYRVAFNTMFVADPLFTIWLLLATIALMVIKRSSPRRKTIATTALVLSSCYLVMGITNKLLIDSKVSNQLKAMGASRVQYFSTPTPLNNILWYIVAKKDSGFYIGYRSLFDHAGQTQFHYMPQHAALLTGVPGNKDIALLKRFSQGFYTVGQLHDTLVFNDLRFGEIAGWTDSTPSCVFYYYLNLPGANDLIVQRGRFARWDKNMLHAFIQRIRGN